MAILLTNQQTLIQFNNIHNNRYDYNKINYINSSTKIDIVCRQHGIFQQTPNKHKQGFGCRKCANIKTSRNKLLNNENAIKKFNLVHNNRYNYSYTNYISSHDYIDIICNLHGKFTQLASNHAAGSGCPKCTKTQSFNRLKQYSRNKSLGNQPGIFYKIIFTHKTLGFSFIKVGITARTIKRRYSGYLDYNYEIISEVLTTNLESAILENEYKSLHNNKFIFPENCKFGGYTECYSILKY